MRDLQPLSLPWVGQCQSKDSQKQNQQRSKGNRGLFVNTGYSGHGVMCSAGGARRTVDLLLGRTTAGEEPFRVDRPMVERARDVL